MPAVNDYPVEITPPDITPYRDGNTGIDYMTTLESGRPGPHVMIAAVTHGNELCGAIVLDFLFRNITRPKRGKLTLGFNNYKAFQNFDPAFPGLSRYVDEDLNRLWSEDVLDGTRDSWELERARAVRPMVDQADFLLDIHSMQTKTPALVLAGPLAKGRELAAAVGCPEYVVCDEGHAAGKRMRDYGEFGDPASPKNALLVECGQHWERASVDIAMQTSLRFLKHMDILNNAFINPLVAGNPPPQKFIEVTQAITIENSSFRFVENFVGMEVIPKAGTPLGYDGDDPVTTPYDNCVLIMPTRRTTRGHTAVRLGRFV